MIIGITGQIGAGKSTATNIFKKLGAAVIDADLIGKEVVENNSQLLKKLTRAFGSEIITKTKNLNRKKLAQLAFENEITKKKLNEIVHPYLLKELNNQLFKLIKNHELVVIDAALLLDWDLDKKVDLTLVIHTSQKTRFKRLKTRGVSNEDAQARQNAQLPFSQYQKRADILILNNKTAIDLERKLKKIFTKSPE